MEIWVNDGSNEILKKGVDQIFQPFLTTKPAAVRAGFVLSLSFDIIKARGREVKVESKEGKTDDISDDTGLLRVREDI